MRRAGWILGAAAAFALGWAARPQAPTPARASAEARVRDLPPPVAIASTAALRAEIRRAVREEARAPNVPPAAEPAAPPEPTAEQAQALDRSLELVRGARAAGRWRRDDAIAFRGLLVAMTDEQRAQAFSAIVTALNEGAIVPDDPGAFL